jgi:hypothetical protein
LNRDDEAHEEFDNQGGRTSYSLKAGDQSWTPFRFWDSHRVWDLGLSPGATLDLDTSMVLGQNELDLTGLDLDGLQTNMALGWTEVLLPAEGRFDARVSGAVGGITVVIPQGMAVRLDPGTAMVLRMLPDDFQERDGVYTSPGYAAADNRVDLDVGLAMGLLNIRYAE